MSYPIQTVRSLFAAIQRLDLTEAGQPVAEEATVQLVHSRPAQALLRAFTTRLIEGNPSLILRVRNLFGVSSGKVVAEITLDGVISLPFLVPDNHGGSFYLDQAWVFTVRNGLIQDATLYWCRYQVNKRLAVQRPDVLVEMA